MSDNTYGNNFPQYDGQNNQNTPNNEFEMRQFTSSRRFTLAANIMGPVSLFIGGSLLSTIGLICSILGWNKMKQLVAAQGSMAPMAAHAIKASKVSIGVCAVALALNVIAVAMIMPEMMQMVQSGGYDAMLDGGLSVSGSNSTWG